MISVAHIVVYSKNAEADRAFPRDARASLENENQPTVHSHFRRTGGVGNTISISGLFQWLLSVGGELVSDRHKSFCRSSRRAGLPRHNSCNLNTVD
jgi:hypothetical protein